jgi:sterol desaturase/sphingolipid hydroxylase (fatty acid hydroxylase superfamily)
MIAVTVIYGSLLAVALWEFCWPRRRREFPAVRRRLGNLGFWIVNGYIAGFFVADPAVRPTLAGMLGLSVPSWPISHPGLSLMAGVLLLDFLQYLVHRLEHAVPFLWWFHALHHTDPDVDVTTAVRHHPIEILFTSATFWLAIVVFDIPVLAVLIHWLADFGTAAVQHGNIRLPRRLEQWLQPVLVTTDMHRIHHSVLYEQANSNYGAVLSIWDHFFGTHTRIDRAQHDRIVFGVRELPRHDGLKPPAMMTIPWWIARARVPNPTGRTRLRTTR